MSNRSKLLRLRVRNIGCIGDEGVEIALDDVVCLVGKNNAGKSTILKAYELAYGETKFNAETDRCTWAPAEAASEVELDIHIPKGIGNISEEWKFSDGPNLVIRSRWRWRSEDNFDKSERSTWDPSKTDWSTTEKAGGADNVFKSRLPKPLRIGSLQDSDKTETVLLALALDPFVQEIVASQSNEESPLAKSVAQIVNLVEGMGAAHEQRFEQIAQDVQRAFSGVFPGMSLKLNVSMVPPAIKIADLLKAGSGIRVLDGTFENSIAQQGTGARRALFWSMLRVHNELKRKEDLRDNHRKNLNSQIKKAKGEEKAILEAKLLTFEEGGAISDDDDPALPGYLLLIDEPENALHPIASRAAQRHLYELAEDSDWQVMMTTHSPYFINPLADHTTIVRLERKLGDKSPLTTRTYISDQIKFSDNEKEQLQALQQMDASFSEVFFGSYPILVEGDTEHAAFIASIIEENHELADKVTIVRARGKAILPALIQMLKHFKIDFGILHDSDWPYTSAGKAGMWTTNGVINQELSACRKVGITVRHRCSIPDFERFLGGHALSKGKPLEAYCAIKQDNTLKQKVQALINDLYSNEDHGPAPDETDTSVYLAKLLSNLNSWASANGHGNDDRLKPPVKV